MSRIHKSVFGTQQSLVYDLKAILKGIAFLDPEQ